MINDILMILPIILEPFPISSSGHAQLVEYILLCFNISFVPLSAAMNHFLHGPVACVVALFFYNRWKWLLYYGLRTFPKSIKIIYLGIMTEIPTILLYGIWHCVGTIWFPLSLGFFITALLLCSLRYCTALHGTRWNTATALLLGTAQGIALLPGISRFATTFVVARWLGFSNKKSFELSFLIEFPISIGGFILGLYALHHQHIHYTNAHFIILLLIASLLAYVGFFLIRALVYSNKLYSFWWYMISISMCSFIIIHYVCC